MKDWGKKLGVGGGEDGKCPHRKRMKKRKDKAGKRLIGIWGKRGVEGEEEGEKSRGAGRKGVKFAKRR